MTKITDHSDPAASTTSSQESGQDNQSTAPPRIYVTSMPRDDWHIDIAAKHGNITWPDQFNDFYGMLQFNHRHATQKTALSRHTAHEQVLKDLGEPEEFQTLMNTFGSVIIQHSLKDTGRSAQGVEIITLSNEDFDQQAPLSNVCTSSINSLDLGENGIIVRDDSTASPSRETTNHVLYQHNDYTQCTFNFGGRTKN